MAETRHNHNHKHGQKKKTSKLVPILIIAPLLLTVIIASVFFVYYEQSKNIDDNEIIAKINGVEISAEELSARMAIDEEYVVNKFGKDYKEELNEDFWDLEVKDDDGNNTNPRKYLQDMALKEITEYKVQLEIAKENGILSEEKATYKAFLESFKNENKNKDKDKAFSEKEYYDYYYNKLKEKNVAVLLKKGKPLYADDSVLEKWFDKVKDEKYKNTDSYNFDIYYAYYDDKSNNYNKDSAKAILKNVRQAIKDGNDLNFVRNDISRFVFKQTMDINNANAAEKQKNYPNFYKEAINLKVGGFSDVYLGVRPKTKKKIAYFGVCKKRTAGGYSSFAEVKSEILENYSAEKYKGYVENKVKQAKIEKLENFSKVTGLD